MEGDRRRVLVRPTDGDQAVGKLWTPTASTRHCVLALRALKKAGFVDLQPGPASTLQVQVLEPSVTHQVNVGQVRRWLELGSTNPNEEAKRKRLRELLA